MSKKHVLKEEEMAVLLEQINGTIQIYYLALLLGKHIHLNFEALKKWVNKLKKIPWTPSIPIYLSKNF